MAPAPASLAAESLSVPTFPTDGRSPTIDLPDPQDSHLQHPDEIEDDILSTSVALDISG